MKTPIAMPIASTLLVMTASLLASVSSAEAEYSMDDFAAIMVDAAKSSPDNNVETEDGPVPIVGGFQSGGSGEWEVAISYTYASGDYTATTITYLGDLKFDGTNLQYSFVGPLIHFEPTETVFQHKGVQKAIKSWVGKHDDLNMSVVLGDDEIVLTANCDVSGLNQGKVSDRLKALFIASHGLIWWSEVAEKEVTEEFIKNLQKMKLEYMSPAAFRELTSAHIPVEREGVTEGAWDMSSATSEAIETYLNYGDRVVFESVLPFAMLTDEQRASLVRV